MSSMLLMQRGVYVMKVSVIFTVIIGGCQTQDQNVSYQLTDQNIPTTHIPTAILEDLRCVINSTTCSRLAQAHSHTSAFQVVCFEQRSNESQVIVYLPCNSICDGYADLSTEDQERCTNHCGGYAALCIHDTPASQPLFMWTDSLVCNATNQMCQRSVLRNENFYIACYTESSDSPSPVYMSCTSLCESDSWVDRDKCKHYCAGYLQNCSSTIDMTSTLLPVTLSPTPPWTNKLTCDADEDMCSSGDVPHNENFYVSCYEDDTYPGNLQYKPCRPICISDSGEDQDACEHHCPAPPPWTNKLTCDADEDMCSSSDVPRNENFYISCYEDDTYPGNLQYKPCRPICISDSGEDQDACEHYCPDYSNSCLLTTKTPKRSSTAHMTNSPSHTYPAAWKIVVGVLVPLVVITALIVSWCVWKGRRQQQSTQNTSGSGSREPITNGNTQSTILESGAQRGDYYPMTAISNGTNGLEYI